MDIDWIPAAILPNIASKRAIEGDGIALAPRHDPRVVEFGIRYPRFNDFVSRFTDAFRVPADPVIMIVREDLVGKLAALDPLPSFRDLVALSTIPYARALATVYGNRAIHRVCYSNSFWLYPWMLSKDNEHLTTSTPAFHGMHSVEEFHGQATPELPIMKLGEIDGPLLEVLLRRYYLGKRKYPEDRALFRSLNMAAQAAQLPAGIDVTLYDLGRQIALWVSACAPIRRPCWRQRSLRSPSSNSLRRSRNENAEIQSFRRPKKRSRSNGTEEPRMLGLRAAISCPLRLLARQPCAKGPSQFRWRNWPFLGCGLRVPIGADRISEAASNEAHTKVLHGPTNYHRACSSST